MNTQDTLTDAQVDALMGHIDGGTRPAVEGIRPELARAILDNVNRVKAAQAARKVAQQAAIAKRRKASKAARVARRINRKG